MIVTKHEAAQWKIAKQFENRQMEKTYLAIVHGTPELDADRINAPLGVHPQVREKYAVRPEIGKEAVTFYEVTRGVSRVLAAEAQAAHRPDPPDPRAPVATSSTRSSPTTCTAASSSTPGSWPTPSRRSRSPSSPAAPCTPGPSNSPTPPRSEMVKFEAPLPRRHAAPPRHAPQVQKTVAQTGHQRIVVGHCPAHVYLAVVAFFLSGTKRTSSRQSSALAIRRSMLRLWPS